MSDRRVKDKDDAALLILVGSRIRAFRKNLNWTQQNLAEALQINLSPAVVSRYENGQIDMLLTTYLALARALGVSPNDLVDWDNTIRRTFEPPRGYTLLSKENQVIVDRIIRAFLIEQDSR